MTLALADPFAPALSAPDAIPLLGPYLLQNARLRTLLCGGAGTTHWPLHRHEEHELFWGVRGIGSVIADGQLHVLLPGSALLVPAMVPHELHIQPDTSLKCTLISANADLRCHAVRPLAMPSVIAEIVSYLDTADVPSSLRTRMESIAIELLANNADIAVSLPMPRDERLLRVTRAVCAAPGEDRPVADWSAVASMSLRSFTRRFRLETGMSFGAWQVLARMRMAMALLEEGRPLAQVAARVGYSNISAFVTAFRRTTGHTPGSARRLGADWPDDDTVWPQRQVAAE